MKPKWDTIIVGGGPSGLAAAGSSAGSTLVIERMGGPGKKLLMTGGGRCNITHDTDADGVMDAFGKNGRFMRQALNGCGPSEIRDFLAKHGVRTSVDKDGCVFPESQDADDILEALVNAAKSNGVEFRSMCCVEGLLTDGDHVIGVSTDQGDFKASRVILALGGKSYAETGSDGSGFALAEKAGLSVTRPVPGLAGLFVKKSWSATLAGTILDNARVRLPGKGSSKDGYTGPVLFTHRGVSGPPVLAVSGEAAARLADGEKYVALEVSVDAGKTESDWLMEFDNWRLATGSKKVAVQLGFALTKRMAQVICEAKGIGETTCARLRKDEARRLARFLSGMPLTVTGTEGWGRAMITRGGVALKELDPATMVCRRVPGLYCVGEIVDLDGECGGYNLTWAIASGRLAGRSTEQGA